MRCRSGVITLSPINARAHARIDQGTAIQSRIYFERRRRVSGLVQRVMDDNLTPLCTAAVV
jgi:hypothetical protein